MAKVLAKFSKSFARRRFRPNREKVRSTSQRRGRTTKPLTLALRPTIPMRSSGTVATKLGSPLVREAAGSYREGPPGNGFPLSTPRRCEQGGAF